MKARPFAILFLLLTLIILNDFVCFAQAIIHKDPEKKTFEQILSPGEPFNLDSSETQLPKPEDANINTAAPNLFVPEAFSPNGDGINDILTIFGNYFNLNIKFYSSVGEFIYLMTPQLPAWDGNIDGDPAPVGVYYWQASFENESGDIFQDEGIITLIR